MPQVICTSRHARLNPLIGGVKFFTSDVGRISEEITDEQASEFLKTETFFKLHEGDLIEPKKPIENDLKVKRAVGRAAPPAPPQPPTDGRGAEPPGF